MFTFPTATLKNGVKVMNFSSPHPFTFDDGTVLAAVADEQSRLLSLDANEVETPNPNNVNISDIGLSFRLNDTVVAGLNDAIEQASRTMVDVVLVPLPVMTALKEAREAKHLTFHERLPFRTVRMTDRVKKLVSSTRFCV